MRPSRRAPDELRPVLLERSVVKYAEGSCMVKFGDTHVLVTVAWTCPLDGGELRYRATLFHDVDPTARHLAIIATESGERELALDSRAPEVALSGAGSSALQVVGRFVQAGIEHIFLGYDHIAFLPRSCFGRSVCGR